MKRNLFTIISFSFLLTGCFTSNQTQTDEKIQTTNLNYLGKSLKPFPAQVIESYDPNKSASQQYCTRSWLVLDKENAGIFYDENPSENLTYFDYQYCRKDQFKQKIDGVVQNVMRVMCRQPNGKFCYLK